MLIIVEGPDGAGKTTLCHRLAEYSRACGVEPLMLHKGPFEGDPFDEYEAPLEHYRPHHPWDRVIICDRWHWGELVYGPLLRGRSKLDAAGFRHVEMFLASRGAVMVHVYAGLEVLEQRLKDRGDDLITADQLPSIVDEYARVNRDLAMQSVPRVGSDISVEQIFHEATQAALKVVRLNGFESYVGPPNPRMVLLGERRGDGPTASRFAHLDPCFIPRGTSSGRFLLNSLPEVWSRIGMVNALDDDVGLLDEALPPPHRFVALGRAAHQATLDASVEDFGSVPHPQYVRRFHHGLLTEYGDLIASMLDDPRDELTWPNS